MLVLLRQKNQKFGENMSKNKRYNSFVTKLGVGFDPVLDVIEAVETLGFDDLTKIPPFNIKKATEKDYSVEISLPGVKKEDINLTIDADYLTIAAEVKAAYDPEGDDVYFYKGIFQGGKFAAKFVIAKNLQFDSADLVDGILTVKFHDHNEVRTLTRLAIGPFPKVETNYVVEYNSAGEPVLIPAGENVETSENAVVMVPSVPEVPAEGTVETVVNAEDTSTVTTTVVLPEELPQIVEVKLEDVVAQTNESSSEPQATIVVTDATYEVSDNVTLEVIKTEEGATDIIVAIPEEVKIEAEAQGIDIIADVTAAIEQTTAAETVTLPVVEETVVEETKVETIEVLEDNNKDVKFEIEVPAELPAVVELVEAPTSTEEAPVLTLDTAVETTVSPEAILIPVVTPEGQNDIVVAVEPELHDKLVEAGVDIAADVGSAVIAADVTVTTTEEPTVSVVVNALDQEKPTVEVILPEVLPAVVEVKVEEIPVVIDNVSQEPQIVITVEPATAEIATDDASLSVIKTDEGLIDVVVAVDKEVEAALEEKGIDVLETVKEAFESTPAVTAEVVVEPTPEVVSVTTETQETAVELPTELPPVVEVTVVDDKVGISEITEIPTEAELIPVVTPEGHDDVVAVVTEETKAALEELDTTVTEVVAEAVAEVAAGNTIAVGEPVSELNPNVEVTLPAELPQIVAVEATTTDGVTTLEVSDATVEVSDTAELVIVKTEEGSSDVILAIEPEVKAELEAANIDVAAEIAAAIVTEDAAPALPEAATEETTTVLVDKADEEKTTVDVVTPDVVTQIMEVVKDEVKSTDDVPAIELVDTSETVSETAELIPVLTPAGQPDIIVAIEPELKAELETAGVDVQAAVETAVIKADVTVETVVEVDAAVVEAASEVPAVVEALAEVAADTTSVVAPDTIDIVVNADDKKAPTVEVTLPTELPQIVEVSIDTVVDKTNTKSEEPQVSVTLTDATHEVSDNVTLEVVKTPEGNADLIVAIPADVQAVLDEKKIDIMPAIEEAVASQDVAFPVLVEAPVEPATVEVTAVAAEALKPETEVTINVPAEVTPVMSAEVVVTDDLGTTVTLAPADVAVPADAELVPVVTPEGQPDIVVAVSEEAKIALESGGQELSTVLEAAVNVAAVEVATAQENPEVLIDSTEKSDL